MNQAALEDHRRYFFNVWPVYAWGRWMLENFPMPIGYGITRAASEIAYRFNPTKRAAVEGNILEVLRHTQPDMPDGERVRRALKIAHRVFWNRGVFFADLSALAGRRSLSSLMRVERSGDWESFARHARSGRGAIVASAHLGNWHVGSVLMGRAGVPVRALQYDNRNATILFEGIQRRGRAAFIGASNETQAVLEIVRRLRRGEVIAMMADIPWGSRFYEAPFFGRPASFPIGPLRLARLAEVPIYPAFCTWTRPRHYQAMLYDPIEVRGADPEAAERQALGRLVPVFEDQIASNLPLWFGFTPAWDPKPAAG